VSWESGAGRGSGHTGRLSNQYAFMFAVESVLGEVCLGLAVGFMFRIVALV
jgi:hypothetical protein